MYKKNLVFSGACLGMLLFGITLITLGSIAPDLKTRFGLDGVASGTLFSILPVGILTGSLLFGPVIDRYGYKLLMILACIGMFAGIQGISHASSLTILKPCIYLYGVGAGIINGATNALVADISVDHKGADLSLLGFFFGIGALGMPLLLGLLSGKIGHLEVVAAVGWVTLSAALLYGFTRFPPAKIPLAGQGGGGFGIVSRLANPLLVLISLFLFFQSSLEAIINNWTTTYLIDRGVMTESNALYALSLHILGMTVMRLLTGSLFRSVSQTTILWVSLLLLAMGVFFMQTGASMSVVVTGLILSGAGIAGGFPIMLGFVGERFVELSGTAFSFVFVVALVGNMLINYGMGLVVHAYGVSQLTTVCYAELVIMGILCVFIFGKLKSKKNFNYAGKTMAHECKKCDDPNRRDTNG